MRCDDETRPHDRPRDRAMKRPLSVRRLRIAWIVAAAADLLQVVLLPVFAEGAASPFDVALDLAVFVILSIVVGPHWAFAPSVIVEMVPGLDLAPTWVVAVWLATRGRRDDRGGPQEPLPPDERPAIGPGR
jgi:hypothetical protein